VEAEEVEVVVGSVAAAVGPGVAGEDAAAVEAVAVEAAAVADAGGDREV
jgi:hypothetical protein